MSTNILREILVDKYENFKLRWTKNYDTKSQKKISLHAFYVYDEASINLSISLKKLVLKTLLNLNASWTKTFIQ